MKRISRLSSILVLFLLTIALAVSGAMILRSSWAFAEGTDWDNLVSENMSGARVAYGAGWGADAAKKVGNAFGDKWQELSSSDSAAQLTSGVSVYPAADDGNAVAFGMKYRNGGETADSYLLYNVINDEAYTVTGDFVGKIGELRRIGAPVTDALSDIKVTGYDGEGNRVDVTTTVQVFETGILAVESGNVVKHEGVIEKISDSEYKIHPLINDQDILARDYGSKIMIELNGEYPWLGFIGDVDGTWHALRTARLRREDGNIAVEYNFRAGCIKVVYTDGYYLVSRMAYAGQNFVYDANGNSTREILPIENFTTDEHLWEGVESNALSMYKLLSGNGNATENDMKNDFRAAYMELLKDGIIPGYRCSSIKIWDILCVDYKYSPDSMYGFDGVGSAVRERMFTLVYSGVQKKVYGVGDDFWNIWRDDSVRRALGAPVSNALTDVTISGTHFSRIQIFEQGYIYESEKGSLIVEYGVTTDGEYKEFSYKAAPPDKPSQYGALTEEFNATENGRKVVYLNYEKGAVKATETNAKTGYLYDYFPGRNFEENNGVYTAKLLSFDRLYNESDFTCDAAYNDIFEGGFNEEGDYVTGVKAQLIEKIQELLDEGFFPGFLESNFQSWNLVACQQFIYGDSTALPWGGDARTNVSAMVWNDEKSELYLLKDAFMELWGGSSGAYSQLGAPAGEEFTLESNPNVTFQYFLGTSSRNNKAFAVCVGYNEATFYAPNDYMAETVNPERYLASLVELSTPISGVTIVPPESTSVSVGNYVLIDYIVDGAAADATITITSSNEEVAEVMADDSVEFKKSGTVTITVTVSDGVNTYTDSVTFTVSGGGSGCGSTLNGDAAIIAGTLLSAMAAIVISLKKKRV